MLGRTDHYDHRWEPTNMGLPRRAQQLPLTAISLGLQAWERSRGLREFALRRGNEALQIAAHTPLGRLLPHQDHDDDADAEAARIVADAREATAAATTAATTAATKPDPRPAPPAAQSAAARSVGAPGAVAHEVEELADTLDVHTPQSRDELPIADFDNISIGSLRARLRTLSVEDLVVLRNWEEEHANRLNVMTTLDNRIAKVAAAGTQTSGANGTAAGSGPDATRAQTDVGAAGTDYPQEATAAQRAAEGEGGTLRI
jgi:hypothetical protein